MHRLWAVWYVLIKWNTILCKKFLFAYLGPVKRAKNYWLSSLYGNKGGGGKPW